MPEYHIVMVSSIRQDFAVVAEDEDQARQMCEWGDVAPISAETLENEITDVQIVRAEEQA